MTWLVFLSSILPHDSRTNPWPSNQVVKWVKCIQMWPEASEQQLLPISTALSPAQWWWNTTAGTLRCHVSTHISPAALTIDEFQTLHLNGKSVLSFGETSLFVPVLGNSWRCLEAAKNNGKDVVTCRDNIAFTMDWFRSSNACFKPIWTSQTQELQVFLECLQKEFQGMMLNKEYQISFEWIGQKRWLWSCHSDPTQDLFRHSPRVDAPSHHCCKQFLKLVPSWIQQFCKLMIQMMKAKRNCF